MRFRPQITRGLLQRYLEIFTGGRVPADREFAQIVLTSAMGLHASTEPPFQFFWLLGGGVLSNLGIDGQIWRYHIQKPLRRSCLYGEVAKVAYKIMFNRTTSHPLPNPWLCELHLVLCRVAHACGAAKALDDVFYCDLDIMCPVAGEYTLPTTRLLVLIILT